MFTIRNSFHGSSARTRGGWLSTRTQRRLKDALCGVRECTCSGAVGERGPQDCTIEYGPWGEVFVGPGEMSSTKLNEAVANGAPY